MTQPTATEPDCRAVAEPQEADLSSKGVVARVLGAHPAWLGVTSGLLLAISYEPVGAWWLAWVALVPLLLLVRSERPARTVYLGAWLGGLSFWLIAVEWVRASDESAWPGWLALAFVLSFWWPVALGLIRVMVRRVGLPLMLAAPAAWIAVEYIRGLYPLNGFQWFFLGHSTYRLVPLIQVADLTGAWGLGVLVMLVNAWIVGLIEGPRFEIRPTGRRPARGQVIRTAVVFGSLGGSLVYGGVRLSNATFTQGPTLSLIQSDIPQIFGGGPGQGEVLRNFQALVARAVDDQPDVIVWPETMFPFGWIDIDPDLPRREFDRQVIAFSPDADPDRWAETGADVQSFLHSWTDEVNMPMIVGINTYYFRPAGLIRHNTALVLEPRTTRTSGYHKLHLVPFGEYVPLVQTIPWVLALTPFDADHMPNLDPGPEAATLRVGPWTFGAPICFEDSVPQVARRLAIDDEGEPVDILLNLSNDGWFRGTAAHQLHLANSVLRAVEFRVPVARAVNTGTTALIDGNGRILASLDPPDRDSLPGSAEGVLTVQVPLDDRSSLYLTTGDWLPIACLGLTIGAIPVALVRGRRRPA